MKIRTNGGVTAAKGFVANGIHCGIRKNKDKKDLAMYYCEHICTAAAVHTTNKVIGAPNTVTKAHLENGFAQAMSAYAIGDTLTLTRNYTLTDGDIFSGLTNLSAVNIDLNGYTITC